MMLFAPLSINNDFSSYNTFLSKLNPDECIVEGKLTQGIPFIIDMADLDVDLTKDDVLGEKVQFVPQAEEGRLVRTDDFGTQTFVDEEEPEQIEQEPIPVISAPSVIESEPVEEEPIVEKPVVAAQKPEIIEPITNIMEEPEEETSSEPEIDSEQDFEEFTSEPEISEEGVDELLVEDDELGIEEDVSLTDEDLNFIEETQPIVEEDFGEYEESPYVNEQSPVVPVYPAEDEGSVESVGEFSQGDSVTHPRYGRGVIEKIIKYGNKTLCSISFENVGRRLLDPTISELTKLG